jgi:hypothetical protein
MRYNLANRAFVEPEPHRPLCREARALRRGQCRRLANSRRRRMANHQDEANEPTTERVGIRLHDGPLRKPKAGGGNHPQACGGKKKTKIKRRGLGLIVAVSAIVALLSTGHAQESLSSWAASASDRYLVFPDQSYGYFSGVSVKLDVWQVQTKSPCPPSSTITEADGFSEIVPARSPI